MATKKDTQQVEQAEQVAPVEQQPQSEAVQSDTSDNEGEEQVQEDKSGASSAATYGKTAEEIIPEPTSVPKRENKATKKVDPKSSIEQAGKSILADYPDAEEVYMTADGFGFFDEHDAREHAKRLDDKDVVTVKNK